MRIWSLALALDILLAIAAGPGMAADVEAGKTAFKKCALCHTTEAGKNKIGPSLFGVVGRKSAGLDNFNYSEGMKKFDHTWDEGTLDEYLADAGHGSGDQDDLPRDQGQDGARRRHRLSRDAKMSIGPSSPSPPQRDVRVGSDEIFPAFFLTGRASTRCKRERRAQPRGDGSGPRPR